MLSWLQITLILCAFGLLREIRPSEPFVTEFLLGEWRDISEEQLNREVYPIGTYCYLGLLVVVFLITDFLRFKPVIILSGESFYLFLFFYHSENKYTICISLLCFNIALAVIQQGTIDS